MIDETSTIFRVVPLTYEMTQAIYNRRRQHEIFGVMLILSLLIAIAVCM